MRLAGAAPLLVLAASTPATYLAVFFATNPALPGLPGGALVIRRAFAVGGGLHADVDVTSYATTPIEVNLDLAFDADFADVFEVKRAIEAPQGVVCTPASSLVLGRAGIAVAGASRTIELQTIAGRVVATVDGAKEGFRIEGATG